MSEIQKISTCLWFDGNAEEAVARYAKIFDDSRVVSIQRFGKAGPGVEGSVLSIVFELEGREFIALNGGPGFKFNEAISLVVKCETQAEIDRLWQALLDDGGAPQQCGWLKDQFGLSWQITPSVLYELLQDRDSEKSDRVMAALLKMVKLDIAQLQAAYDGI